MVVTIMMEAVFIMVVHVLWVMMMMIMVVCVVNFVVMMLMMTEHVRDVVNDDSALIMTLFTQPF